MSSRSLMSSGVLHRRNLLAGWLLGGKGHPGQGSSLEFACYSRDVTPQKCFLSLLAFLKGCPKSNETKVSWDRAAAEGLW